MAPPHPLPPPPHTLPLLSSHLACSCSSFGTNLGNDKTELKFSAGQLQGMPEAYLKQRTGDDGLATVTLKYPDIIPIGR
jgi:hypothetical protein